MALYEKIKVEKQTISCRNYYRRLEQAVGGIGLYVNANKTDYMYFKREAISNRSDRRLKLVHKFTYFDSNISSTGSDFNVRLAKERTAINRLSIIWKSDLSDKMKWYFYQSCVFTTQTKRIEKMLDANYTRMLRAILNRLWKQHPAKQLLNGH